MDWRKCKTQLFVLTEQEGRIARANTSNAVIAAGILIVLKLSGRDLFSINK